MSPTMKLRQVQRGWRQIGPLMIGGPANTEPIYVLQQWWAPFRIFSDGAGYQEIELIGGEWRDVPVEEE